LCTFAYRYLTFSGFSNDHFVHLATAQQITLGLLPVRDYAERGLPLMSAVSAMAQAALGSGLLAEVQLIAAAFAAAAILIFLVAARLGESIAIGAAAAAATVLVHPASYSYPKLLAYAIGFVAALGYCARPSLARLVVLAAAVVAAFLFRHDHGVFLAAASVLMLASLHGLTRAAMVSALRFAIAGVLLVSPYLLWVQAYDGLGAYAADGMAFSRREAERSMAFEAPRLGIDRSRPLFRVVSGGPVVNVRWSADVPAAAVTERERAHALTRLESVGPLTWRYELRRWSSAALERLVRDPAVADTHGIDRSRYRLGDADPGFVRGLLLGKPVPGEGLRLRGNALALLFWLSWAIPALAAVALALSRKQTTPSTRALVVMIVAVQIAMNVTMLRDPLDLRIRDVVAPMAAGLAFVAGRAWAARGGLMLRWTGRGSAAVLILITVASAAALGPIDERLSDSGVFDGFAGVKRRWTELHAELRPPAQRTGAVSEAYQRLVDYVSACTPTDSRLFAMTFAPELFFYTGRGFAAGQVSLTPGYYVADRHATLMLERLSREDVPLVIFDSETEREMAEGYPRVAAHVSAAYERIADFPVSGDKRFIVLAERGRKPVRLYGAGQLPCYAAGQTAGITLRVIPATTWPVSTGRALPTTIRFLWSPRTLHRS